MRRGTQATMIMSVTLKIAAVLQHVLQNSSIKLSSFSRITTNGISSEARWDLWWIYIIIILLSVGLICCGHGFNFIHSRVEVLDVLWGVQTSRVVVLVGYNFGAKRKSAPVVAGANVFHFLLTQGRKRAVSFGNAKVMRAGFKNLWNVHAAWNVQNTTEQTQEDFIGFGGWWRLFF